jgi:hypothetical protein
MERYYSVHDIQIKVVIIKIEYLDIVREIVLWP